MIRSWLTLAGGIGERWKKLIDGNWYGLYSRINECHKMEASICTVYGGKPVEVHILNHLLAAQLIFSDRC